MTSSDAMVADSTTPTTESSATTGDAPGVSRPPRPDRPWHRELLQSGSSWMFSLLVHTLAILVLAFTILPELPSLVTADLQVSTAQPLAEELADNLQFEPEFVGLVDDAEAEIQPETILVVPQVNFSPTEELEPAPAPDMTWWDVGSAAPLMTAADATGSGGTGLSGRGHLARAALVRKGGGNHASETAVGNALHWLAQHQYPDGSWSFDHRHGSCQGRCNNAGSLGDAVAGGTALSLLPFLGAGQTHASGQYQQVVARGLAALVRQMKTSREGGSFVDSGNMYSHGLAAIALSEAYGMTNDLALKQPAQLALDFITSAQDPAGGGWRYRPRQPGDTSVVGWQVLALKSGHMSSLRVPVTTVRGATAFLDSVQVDGGAGYGYVNPSSRPATTAIGLLCRMYLGWKRTHPALQAGVARLADLGPTPNTDSDATNYYHNYYAAQVLFQYTAAEGEMWRSWNNRLRDHLVATQDKSGHQHGSWFDDDPHGRIPGGRLYCTALACMTLEVYYRHMPIYRSEAVEAEFPE